MQPFAKGSNRPRADDGHAANDSVMCEKTPWRFAFSSPDEVSAALFRGGSPADPLHTRNEYGSTSR